MKGTKSNSMVTVEIKITKVKPWKLLKFGFIWNLPEKASMNRLMKKRATVTAHLFVEWMNEAETA